ncbi:MAG: peptidase M14 [Rhodobacterales bacterium]|nr:peptidase M14 [Rhodobacterales bacterium]
MPQRLDALHTGFRQDYPDHDAMTAQLQSWAKAFPDLARLSSLGKTPEGRDIWLLTVGRDPDRIRPAAWVDGNMHASELAGTSAALSIAEDLLRVHLGGTVAGLAPVIQDRLHDSLVYVLPRVSPDGAEAVLKTGRYVRSVPRDDRPQQPARWVCEDLDGDGLALVMRVKDPTGEFVESDEFPGLLLIRRPEDAGPFYKVWPEGHIQGFDGHHVPDPNFLGDNYPDLNRNFPFDWRGEHDQVGAGDHPGSEPESRLIIAFAQAHPEIYAWLNLHCFGGVHIRPCGDKPDTKMNPSDLALYRYLGDRAKELTDYPMVSGFEEFTYEPDTPIRGDLSDWAYNQRGCVAWVTEIWDLFAQLKLDRPKRFVDWYTQLTREDMLALANWDKAHNKGRIVRPWKVVHHPQLGDVEVGGLDPRFGCWNPPHERLAEVCNGLSQLWLETVALAPKLQIDVTETNLEGGLRRLSVQVRNVGYLPTNALASALRLPHVEPLRLELLQGISVNTSDQRRELGHLEGWGRGKGDGSGALYFLRSKGSVSSRTVELVVQGPVSFRVGSCRMGWIQVSS